MSPVDDYSRERTLRQPVRVSRGVLAIQCLVEPRLRFTMVESIQASAKAVPGSLRKAVLACDAQGGVSTARISPSS